MKIIDLLKKDTLSLSFEVFPPKTDTTFESVKHATEEIAKLPPRLYERDLRFRWRYKQVHS